MSIYVACATFNLISMWRNVSVTYHLKPDMLNYAITQILEVQNILKLFIQENRRYWHKSPKETPYYFSKPLCFINIHKKISV